MHNLHVFGLFFDEIYSKIRVTDDFGDLVITRVDQTKLPAIYEYEAPEPKKTPVPRLF